MKRRLLAMVLSLAMLMGLLPTAALAAGSGGSSGGAPYQDLGQREEGPVSAEKFVIYKDGMEGGSPKDDVQAGQLSETAPDLTGDNLYFDHAEVNGKRVYEAGTLTEQGITYYGSISGALSILGEGETIGLYYVSKYPVTYNVTGAEKTAGDELVKKGDSLSFRVKPSEKGKRLVVSVNSKDITGTGTVFDDTTGEMLFTVESVQAGQAVVVQEVDAATYTLTYNQESGAFRNGSITGPSSGQSIEPGGTITIQMESNGTIANRYVLNMLVINGREVTTLPSNAGEGAYVTSTLPSGETVTVTLTQEDSTALPVHYANDYTITISNIYTDLYISEANFKLDDRNEVIIKELTGIGDIVGWDGGTEEYATGSINHVYLQTTRSGNEFYFNLKPGYEKPQLTVKVNGQASSEDMHFEENIGKLHDGRDPSYTQEQYQYRFDLPNGLGDNIELFLTATPITYSVEYQNDKNNNDLIGKPETGFTVVEGSKDTITITSRTPYEVEGFVPDGYKIKGNTNSKIYRAGETVKVSEIAGFAQGNTIVFVPNWLAVEEAEERQITIYLYIEDPTNGDQIKADEYVRTVGSGEALFRPNEERGREHIREYISSSDESWKDTYNDEDFVLREGGEIQVVKESVSSLDFHFDVKKGNLTVKFQWGAGEQPDTAVPALPENITEQIAIKQAFSVDVSESIPEGYTASMTTVAGTMIEAGVEKTVYLYKDTDNDNKPDNHTITLTFAAGENGTINPDNLTPGGTLSEDRKALTYKLAKPVEGELEGDKYPQIPQVNATAGGMVWTGWFNNENESSRYADYANQPVGADAADLTFDAHYDAAEGHKEVAIRYYTEQESGEFDLAHTLTSYRKPGETVTYGRPARNGYVTPNEGTSGTLPVTEEGPNTANVYYYLDTDNNDKPDTYTVTLTFRGTGHGSWDIEDTMWEQMEEGKDYIYDTDSRALKVFLVKANEAGFEAETYPAAPKVNPEDGWLFDSWQDDSKHAYGSGAAGDGITVGNYVGAEDANKSYTSAYDRDLNGDGTPDDEQYVTITFQAGEHGTFADSENTVTYDELLPGYSSYPEAPAVTESTGWQFAGWSPEYDKSGTIEETVQENQTYTATYRGQGTLTYDGNAQRGGTVSDLPNEQTVWEGNTVELSGQTPTHTPVNETSVVFIGWSRTKTGQIYGSEDQEAFEKITLLPGMVYINSTDLRIYAVWGYDTDGDQKPDVTEPTEKPNLTNVVPPAAITVENGTAIEDMGLPTQVTIQTTKGDMQANVTWDTQNTSYDPSKAEAQTFTLNGTVMLPEGVTNTDEIPLTTTISITANAKDEEPGPDPSKSYTLTYDANGGFGGPGQEKVSADEAENYQLNTTDKPTHKTAEDGTMIIFIGWSAEQDTKIYGASDKDGPNTIDKLTLTTNDEVYAVWGYDANEDGTPDVEEDGKYTLAYDGNAINDGDQVAGVPDGGEIKYVSGQVAVLDTEEPTYTLAPATDDSAVIPGPTDGPETETPPSGGEESLPSGESTGEEEPTESEPAETDPVEESISTEESEPPVETTPAHVPELASIGMTRLSYRSAGDGSGDSVVFIGWSLNQHRQIFKGTDTEAFKHVQIVPAVTFDDEDITVYAVWGYDSDNDGTADVLGENYVIRSYAGPNGSIDPNGDTTVAEGGDQGFTFIPDSGYAVDKIVIDGDTYLNDGNLNLAGYDADSKTYTFTNVQADRSIVVTFSADADGDGVPDKYDPAPSEKYTVTARVNDGNGTITPVSKTVDAGDDVVFTITANGDYALDYITVDGKVVYSNNDAENPFKDTWTLKNVQANSEVVAYFGEDQNGDNVPDAPTYLTVTARAGENGSISPSGTLLVKRGESQSFSITASSDYHISDVAVNGVSVGAVSSYEMISISENMTITASFARDSSGGGSHTTRYTITASAGKGGEISPDGSVRVVRGSSKTFTITPDAGYVIEDVLVDGESVGAVDKYTFENVREKHTIEAVFAEQNGGVADPDDTGVSGWLNTKDHSAYLGGYGGGWFGPDDNMTRAQVAQMFYNLLLNKNVPITVSFSDVAPDAWYAEAVNTLGSLGIVAGIGNGQFAPDRAITRAEFTVIAMRFAELDTSGENIFTDVSENDWFYDYVVGAIKYGWITGYSDGRFGPYDTITRAQVTTIVNRMLDRRADEAYVDRHADELEQFTDVPDTHWAFYEVAEATNAHDYDRTSGCEEWMGLK